MLGKKQINKEKSLIPWIFIGAFSLILLVDLFYIYLASSTWQGLYTENSYQKGLNYNQTLSAIDDQEKLGWDLAIKYENISPKKGILLIDLHKDGNIISGANLVAKIVRPVSAGHDFSIPLSFNKMQKKYQAVVSFPLKGQWDIEIIAKKDGLIYQDKKRFIIH